MQPLIKSALIATIMNFAISGIAYADQCQLIKSEYANNALQHIKLGSIIVKYCEPCGDKDFHDKAKHLVNSISAEKTQVSNKPLWEVKVNGKGIDLAYTYIETGDGTYVNLSKLSYCPSNDVSIGFNLSTRMINAH